MTIAPVATASLMVVGHGTRDADGLEEFWTLAEHVREAAGELPVGFGFIELAEPLVDQGIDELVGLFQPFFERSNTKIGEVGVRGC